MRAEMLAQPERVARIVADGATVVAEAVDLLRRRRPKFLMICARGTSDHAALYAKYLVEIELGIPTSLASPSTFSLYDSRMRFEDVAMLLISQSGKSPDLLAAAEAALAGGGTTIAVTNSPGSPLARVSDSHIHADAGPELAVAATKSYTAALMSLWLLVRHWKGVTLDPAGSVPAALERALHEPSGVDRLANKYVSCDRIIVTGRGYDYATAREAALKLTETSYVAAQAFSGADLLHGPIAQVGASTPVIVLDGPGIGGRSMGSVAEQLIARGADVALLSSMLPKIAKDESLLPDSLWPIVQIAPLQRFALESALLRGWDPDRPRGLSKVTRTL